VSPKRGELAIYALSDKLVRLTPATRTVSELSTALETVGKFPVGRTPLFEYGVVREQREVDVVWRGKPRGEIVGGTRVVVH
jgi:hypothetical protein